MWQPVSKYAPTAAPQTPAPAPEPAAAENASHPVLTPAVLHCWTAYQQTYALERGKGSTHNDAYQAGATAYRDAIPCLSDQESIRDFIACVTHGMVLQIIPTTDGAKLLYAANVASGAIRRTAEESKSEVQAAKLQAA